MEERLSIGQVIDLLEIEQEAQACCDQYKGRKIKKTCNGIVFTDNYNHSITLSAIMLESRWRILPKYVTFMEAMQAHDEGRDVKFYPPHGDVESFTLYAGDKVTRIGRLPDFGQWSFISLYKGKWEILKDR